MDFFSNHAQGPSVNSVCAKLRANGYLAWLAGGCVRDHLMSRVPHDFDIATDATPDQVETLFPEAIAVGKSFGVIVVPRSGYQIEIATFRTDGEYTDGRRPENIIFASPEEDARRRDFTCNALFYDPSRDLILDFVEGEKDIRAKLIRAVGDPFQRFREDKLRMLRAVRFAAQLGFSIDPGTWSAILAMHREVKIVSRERIRDELKKLLKSEFAIRGLKLLWESGLGADLFPELDRHLHKTSHWTWFENHLRPRDHSWIQVLALMLFPWFKQHENEARTFLNSLKLSAKETDRILWILREAPLLLEMQTQRKGEVLHRVGTAGFLEAKNLLSPFAEFMQVPDPTEALAELQKELPEGELPKAWVTGDDLKALGILPGEEMGKWIKKTYLDQLEGRFKNRDEALRHLAQELANL